MLDNVQRAAINLALQPLEADPDFKHRTAIIIQVAGEDAAKEVTALAKEYREANKAAKENGGAMLSGEAADWWQEAQGALASGRLALSQGSRLAEKTLSQKCERLEESFDARVPEQDKPKFVVYDVQAEWALGGDGYDERWDWTVDHRFPLLSPQFQDALPVKNPAGEAQRVILMGLLDQHEPEEQVANASRLKAMISEFRDEREAKVAKENLAASKVGDRHRKAAKRYEKRKLREAAKAARQFEKAVKCTVSKPEAEPETDAEKEA